MLPQRVPYDDCKKKGKIISYWRRRWKEVTVSTIYSLKYGSVVQYISETPPKDLQYTLAYVVYSKFYFLNRKCIIQNSKYLTLSPRYSVSSMAATTFASCSGPFQGYIDTVPLHIWAHMYIFRFFFTHNLDFFSLKMYPKNHALSVSFELNNFFKWLRLITLYEEFSHYLFSFLPTKHFCVTNNTSMNILVND